jgi:enoyl-[acyl-carrier protein] reductase/trans-2-enoyl-CoA reductase (NAD+)
MAFGAGTDSIGVFFERPACGDRTASAGWYNTVAFTKIAQKSRIKTININGDAFSNEIKRATIDVIKSTFGKVDLVIYSLAAPRRVDPSNGDIYRSVLKPIGSAFTSKTVNTDKGIVSEVMIEQATDDEIRGTVAVMGGDDWSLWINALLAEGALERGCKTIAYSYIGPELTWPIYREGTIGRAKADLDDAAKRLKKLLSKIDGDAVIAVNKAVVTQASSAIPVVPLYISLLFKVMKKKNLHEDCIHQMNRLFRERVYATKELPDDAIDSDGRWRIDDLEMRKDVQSEVAELWPVVCTENLRSLSDFDGYSKNFLRLFGFVDDIDCVNDPVEIDLPLEGVVG